jgi:hypothetical protein
MYCYRHQGLAANPTKTNQDAVSQSKPDPRQTTSDVSSSVLVQEPLILGCPPLSNVFLMHSVDPAFCRSLRMDENDIDFTSVARRKFNNLPLRTFRQLEVLLNNCLTLYFKEFGKFQFAKPTYITSVRSRRNPHVSQVLHRDVDMPSPPGYLSIILFLDSTSDGSGGLEIWKSSSSTLLHSPSTTRALGKCDSMKIVPQSGSMVIFDARLVHRGLANTSLDSRVAIHVFAWPVHCGLVPLTITV